MWFTAVKTIINWPFEKDRDSIFTTMWKTGLIIHEENTKEMMSVKEFVYLIQNHADLHKL